MNKMKIIIVIKKFGKVLSMLSYIFFSSVGGFLIYSLLRMFGITKTVSIILLVPYVAFLGFFMSPTFGKLQVQVSH